MSFDVFVCSGRESIALSGRNQHSEQVYSLAPRNKMLGFRERPRAPVSSQHAEKKVYGVQRAMAGSPASDSVEIPS